jgi:hypothetical protein
MASRSFNRLLGKALIAAILFAQTAISAYACPSLLDRDVKKVTREVVAVSMLADCDQMSGALDPAAPNLCWAHCHNHEQSADHADVPMLLPALFVALYWLAAPAMAEPRTRPPETSVLHAALPPPHAILHCCFRI